MGASQWDAESAHSPREVSSPGRPSFASSFLHRHQTFAKAHQASYRNGVFSKIRGRMSGIRISMYVPINEEISTLSNLLNLLEEAIGLKDNFHKSTGVPIWCSDIDIVDILADMPAQVTHFQIKYLVLHLTTSRLRRVDFQPLVDKVATRLNAWNGCNLNHAGRP